MKTVLVPTDFSSNAQIALEYAAMIAKKANANLILTHCCALYEEKFSKYKSLIEEHNSIVVEDIFSKLNELASSVQSDFGVNIEVALYKNQDITASILQAGIDYKADLIIMGTYGATGLRRTLFGSKTAVIINQSEIPVLTIPPTYKWNELKNIVLAVKDEFENIGIIRPVFDIAEMVDAKVLAIVFTKEEAEAFEMMAHSQSVDLIKRKFNRIFNKINTNSIHLVGHDFHKSVKQFVLENKVDLLCMITHKRSFFQSIFDNSMTQKMSYYSTIPLLSLHELSE